MAKRTKPVEEQELLTVKEVADKFRVHPRTVLSWVRQGRLPYRLTLGRHYRFRQDEINKLLKLRTNMDAEEMPQ